MNELKPCPFCGSRADYADVPESIPTCTNPKCKMSFALKMSDEGWNTRPIEDAQSALIEQLGEALVMLGTGGVSKREIDALTAYREWKGKQK